MEIAIRAAIIFLFLLLITRVLGKRELAEMSPFELLVIVTMGDLVQQGVTQEDFSLTGAFIAVGTMTILSIVFSYAQFKWPRSRAALQGPAAIVVRNGRVRREILRIERMTIDDLHEAAREKGIDDLGKVKVAVLEPDGRFSFFTKEEQQDEPEPDHKG